MINFDYILTVTKTVRSGIIDLLMFYT